MVYIELSVKETRNGIRYVPENTAARVLASMKRYNNFSLGQVKLLKSIGVEVKIVNPSGTPC